MKRFLKNKIPYKEFCTMSGASDVTHLQGGPTNTFQDVVETGHAEVESSYDQLITPVRLQFTATKNVPVQLENIPCSKVIVANLIGNDPIYVGGLAEQTPYFDLNYVGDFRGTVLYEGMSKPFPVRNANRIQVVGTPLQSFTYDAYPNIPQKIITNAESPPNPDTFPPEVLFSDPQDESTGILIDRTDFSITMDEPILPSSVNADNVTITPAGVDYDVFPDPLNNSRIKIVLLENLAYATTYTITVAVGGLKDFSENAIDVAELIQFTTEPSPPLPPPADTTPPTVQATNPLDNATVVPKDKIVTITMSEPMLAASVNTASVTIAPSIDHDVFLNPVNTSQIIVNHTVAFAYSTVYTITLVASGATGVKDVAGNRIASQFIFDFTVEAQPTVPDQTPPIVTAIDPVNGATGVIRNKTISITFSEPILSTSVNTTNVVLAPLIANAVFRDPNNSSKVIVDPTTDLPASTLHTITLPAGGIKDMSDNGLASQLQFGFTTEAAPPPPDTTVPSVTARSPAISATNVPINSAIVVDFSEPLLTPIPANSFELFAPGPVEVTAVTITLENGNARLRMTPNSNLNTSTSYTVFVRTTIEDVAGNNLFAQDSWSFTTAAAAPGPDVTPPTVIARTPAPNATNVSRTTTVIVDFSETMDAATIHSNSIELYRVSDSAEIGCNITLGAIDGQSNRRITLTPTAQLGFATQYQAFVKTLVKDLAGNALAAESSWLFTTVDSLSIVARIPAASASNVATNTAITVDFNKALNTGTVTSSSFRLINVATGIQVAGTITFANGNQRAILTPGAALAMSTQYQVIVSPTVADTTGVTLAAEDSWFFTTIVQFNITNRDPDVSSVDHPIGDPIIIDFNKSVNTTTATVASNNVELYDTSTEPDSEKAVTIAFANGNQRITLTPTTALAYSRVYMVTLRVGLKDTTGASLPGTLPLNYTFTTANNPVQIVQVYVVAGTSNSWWIFGDITSANDRQGRGLKITSTTTGTMNALHNVRPTNVTVTVRRHGNFSAPQDDDTIYCRIRDANGNLKSTLGTYTGALSISTNSQQISFSNANQSYVMVNGDCLLIEYDDGDDDEYFEMLVADTDSSAGFSQEVYRDSNDDLHTTTKDMAATISGQRM